MPAMELDKNTFIITNKKYDHANLAMWGTGDREMGTFEEKVYIDQFWQLKEDPNHPGYYYIYNAKYEGYRLAKWGPGDKEVGSYSGQYYDDQLWKFDQVEGDFYRIYNMKYPDSRLTKFGKEDTNWGTYDGAEYDDQVWKLTPRFKAEAKYVVLWSCDNREGSRDFPEEITVTTGLKLTSSSTVSTTFGFEKSLQASVSYGIASAQEQTKISFQLETSLSHSKEKNWSRQSKVTFTAPKGKNYRVKQLVCDFASPLASDDCALKCNYKVDESDGPFQD